MLQVTPRSSITMQNARRETVAEPGLGMSDVLGFVRRYRRFIGICVLSALALGTAYLMMATPVYVAQAQVFIDPKRPQAAGTATEFNLMQLDSSQLESQIQVVKSERISRQVIRALGLMDDPEFRAPASSFFSFLRGTGGDGSPDAADAKPIDTAVMGRFNERLTVRRIGQSYVLEIGFWSQNPSTAARVANSVTAAYIRDQIVARLDAAQRGGEILEMRIEDLRGQLATLDTAVRTGVIELDSFPTGDGRVITAASKPSGKSWPKSSLVLALATLIGALIGGVGAGLHHAVDHKLRSRRQVETELQVPLLGTLSHVPGLRKQGSGLFGHLLAEPDSVFSKLWGMLSHVPGLRKQPFLNSSLFSHVLAEPDSMFSNDLRCIKAEIEIAMLETKIQCVGIVSLLPGEGKSTVASNLAHAFSAAGRRTLLVDCDVRTHALSTSLAAASQHGLVELLAGSSRIDQAVLLNKRPKPAMLPIVARSSISNFNDILSSESMRRNVQHFREVYDVIFIDLPATTSGPDVRVISPILDAIIVVAEFDATPTDALRSLIESLDRPSQKILGIVLNKFVK